MVFEAARKARKGTRDLGLGVRYSKSCCKCQRDNAPTGISHEGASKVDNGDCLQDANMGVA